MGIAHIRHTSGDHFLKVNLENYLLHVLELDVLLGNNLVLLIGLDRYTFSLLFRFRNACFDPVLIQNRKFTLPNRCLRGSSCCVLYVLFRETNIDVEQVEKLQNLVLARRVGLEHMGAGLVHLDQVFDGRVTHLTLAPHKVPSFEAL